MMRIAHISDSHITPGGEFQKERFSEIVSEINGELFDLVVHTGDITDSGLRRAYKYSREVMQAIKKPLIVIPGNHDSRNVGYELFEEYFGDLNGVCEGEDYILIYVDSSIPDRNEGRVGSSKFEWLKAQLMRYSAKKLKIVAVHHHLIPVPKAGTERNVLFNAGDLLDLFQKYDVDLVLSGHRHYPNVINVDGMVISNAGCMSCRKVRAGDVCSYNEIDITPEGITVAIRRLKNSQKYRYPPLKGEIFVSEGKKLARIVQIAGTFFSDKKIFEKRKFENAVKKINSLTPDVVVHCGDIVEMGIPQHYDLAQMYMEAIEASVVYTPGPRDINYIGYELFPRFGLKNLEDVIKEQEQGISIVFLHHNVVPLPHIREKGLLEDAGDVLKSLCDLQVDLVLTGHSSYPSATKVNNTIISNTNALSCQYVRSLYGNSFNVIDIYKNLVNISEIHSLLDSKRILGIWKRNNKMAKA
jgi:putative phosphoesterase